MGLLLGLPLKLFHILFLVVRLAWPLLLILVLVFLWKRHNRPKKQEMPWQKNSKEPEFHGPVYTVDYQEVDSEEQP